MLLSSVYDEYRQMSSISLRPSTGKRSEKSSAFFGALRNRSFRLLYIGQSASSLGNRMYDITLAWTVYRMTGSAADMGIVLIANAVPQVLFSIGGGVLADRASRRRVILGCNIAAGAATGAVCVAAALNQIGISMLMLCACALGAITAFFSPAYGSVFADVLGHSQLQAANGLRGATSSAIRLCGPAIGGLIFTAGGPALGFGLDSASFFFAAATACLAHVPESGVRFGKTLLSDVREGGRYILSASWLINLIVLTLVVNTLCVAPMEVLLALLVRQSHQGSWFLGTALSIEATATLLGSVAIGKWGDRIQPQTLFYTLAGILACGVAILAINLDAVAILIGVILVGIGFTFSVVEDTVLQRFVSSAYLGRVISVGTLASYSLLPLGYAFGGLAEKRFGTLTVLLAGGSAGLAACIGCWVISRRNENPEGYSKV